MNLLERTINFLRENDGKKFTAREIAQALVKRFPQACEEKKKKSSRLTSDLDLERQIAAEIGAHHLLIRKKCPQIATEGFRPRKYFYANAFVESTHIPQKMQESDLYPVLAYYLKNEHKTWSKRIDEKRSSNRHGSGANRWLFPDLVAFENFSSAWDVEVQNCAKNASEKLCRLWSFEVKREITRSNVRQTFFQAVSNSSWSHLGYLAAAKIDGKDTVNELRILSSRHGIGVLKLHMEKPADSQIIIPALERPGPDWEHINRLTVENKDFRDFIRNMRHFHQTGDLRPKDWDTVG